MNNFIKTLCVLVLMSSASCAFYYYIPITGYALVKSLDVGAPALPYYAYSGTSLESINDEFVNAKAKVTIEDTYTYGYGKSFKDVPPDGDTGQKFTDMATATRYLQNILKAKGVRDSGSYFLTSIDSAKSFGFTLIAAVQRKNEKPEVFDKFGASSQNVFTCDDPPFYQPYRYDCKGKPLDTVYEWAALPNDCYEKQGHQAILLTLTANKLLEKQQKTNYWDAERKWIAGNYKSVVVDQDNMVCQQLGIEKGYTKQKNIFKD
jgi:hypothetical protein